MNEKQQRTAQSVHQQHAWFVCYQQETKTETKTQEAKKEDKRSQKMIRLNKISVAVMGMWRLAKTLGRGKVMRICSVLKSKKKIKKMKSSRKLYGDYAAKWLSWLTHKWIESHIGKNARGNKLWEMARNDRRIIDEIIPFFDVWIYQTFAFFFLKKKFNFIILIEKKPQTKKIEAYFHQTTRKDYKNKIRRGVRDRLTRGESRDKKDKEGGQRRKWKQRICSSRP